MDMIFQLFSSHLFHSGLYVKTEAESDSNILIIGIQAHGWMNVKGVQW